MYETVDGLFTGICDAIREKEGTTALINHQDIPARIEALSGISSIGAFYAAPKGLKIDNGVVSNFNTDIYVYTGKTFRPLDNQWKIQVKFKTPVSWVHYVPTLFSSYVYRGSVQCEIDYENGVYVIWFGFSTDNGNSWTQGCFSDFEIETDTWYWAQIVFNGERYILYISTDGSAFEEAGSINYSGQFYQPELDNSFIFGGRKSSYGNIFDGSIDLKETYIKIGNEVWWGRG